MELASIPLNVAKKLITAHLSDGSLDVGGPIALKIAQMFTGDAAGALVILTLEALMLERVRAEIGAPCLDQIL